MSQTPLNRRDFLRRTTAAAGAAAGLSALTGCGSDPVRPIVPPSAPSDLVARAVSAFRVDVTWSDTSDDETGFEIERRPASGSFDRIVTLPANTVSYRDETVSESTMYLYRIRAVRDAVVSDYASEAVVQTPAAGAPPAPSDLTVREVTESSALLSWTDNSDIEGGFRVQLRGPSNQVTLVANLDPGATEYRVENLTRDTLHRFFVEAFNESGVSGETNEVGVYTGLVLQDLALAVVAPGSMRIDWTDRTSGATGFRIERNLDSGSFSEIAVVPAGRTTFTDSAVPAAGTYDYRVTGSEVAGLDTTPATLTAPTAPPGVPGAFGAAADPEDGSRILLGWTSSGETTGFELDRSTGGAFTKVATIEEPGYADAPAPLLPFTYRVRAFNILGYSAYSGSVTARARAVVRFDTLPAQNDLRIVGRSTRLTLSNVPPSTFSAALGNCRNLPTYIHLVRVSSTEIAAVQGNCTHQCCTTNYVASTGNPPDGRFACPCHGSQFRLDGSIINGPAASPEPTFPTQILSDRVEILAPGTGAPDTAQS